MSLFVTLSDDGFYDEVANAVDGIVSRFNEVADARALGKASGPSLQAVHNWKVTRGEDGRMQVYLDAASPDVLKKLFRGLGKYKAVAKVELDLF